MTDGTRTPGPTRADAIQGGMASCWFCATAVSAEALFCHSCGSLQPPAEMDAFARLRLPPRFDIASADIERQAAGFLRILAPERLEKRGSMEKTMAERRRAALTDAADTLRDPVRRGRLLLSMAGRTVPADADTGAGSLDAEIEAVEAPGDLDRIGAALLKQMERAVKDLAAAFREEALDRAADLTQRLDAMQNRFMRLRARRAALLSGNSQV